MRINKYLATCGVASRRKAEELITKGKVKVNGKVVTVLATDVKPNDVVVCEGRVLRLANKMVYYKLYKPKGYVTTSSDEKDRKTVLDLMRGVHYRVFPVGRLDYDSEGLLILTNDGDLANILTKPNSNVNKTYNVHIESDITKEEIKKLTSGLDLGEFTTKPCSIQLLETSEKLSKMQVTISEGKNRQIRKMFESIGKNVIFLKRTTIGEIRLGGMQRGEYKELNPKEIKYLNSLKK